MPTSSALARRPDRSWRSGSREGAFPVAQPVSRCLISRMSTTTKRPRPKLSTIDRAILAVHGLVAGVVGVVAFVGANDPDWGGLQRLVIVMVIGLWAAGIVAVGLVARLITHRWARALVLVAGPFIGILLVFGGSMLGWG
jgi:hypothetical protein